MRFSDFDLRPEKIALKVKKNMKIGPWFFSDFLTFGAIFSGPRLKSTNRIGHVNCIVLNSRMIPHMTKLIDWFDLWGWWLHVLVPPHLIFGSTLYWLTLTATARGSNRTTSTVNPTNRQVGIDGTVGFLLTQYGHGCSWTYSSRFEIFGSGLFEKNRFFSWKFEGDGEWW